MVDRIRQVDLGIDECSVQVEHHQPDRFSHIVPSPAREE
jgi:hypothetical protein